MTPIRILFVEDDLEMAAVYKENFAAPEFETSTARNGREALKILKTSDQKFRVIVSDRNMPEMDGVTMLKKIRESDPEIRAILVSGMGSWTERTDTVKLGVEKLIHKPVRMDELRNLVRALCFSKKQGQKAC